MVMILMTRNHPLMSLTIPALKSAMVSPSTSKERKSNSPHQPIASRVDETLKSNHGNESRNKSSAGMQSDAYSQPKVMEPGPWLTGTLLCVDAQA
ncbi:hypothetical protein AOXY_G32839 [Acipenser oxyrinchus oxyrinchus]|uniref:Uncharacterized protein n=1 Tax=Acipenser oxyrinchus oxyrinchus TaxID=40147 RepID=A0AAD8CHS9_ACIOX|nr:hypothetical protein AOXY_G32839 [Acipenser oxyrinchus oxyrinchus]